MAKEIFISYSRKDFDKVKAIKDELDSELGIKCWMDLNGIESGEQYKTKIIDAINSHRIFLFMLSPNSMASKFALKELAFAKEKGKRVVLIYITPCQMTDTFAFEYYKYDRIDWSNPLQHDKLLRELRKWFDGTQQPKPTTNEPTDPEEQYTLAQSSNYGSGDFARVFISYKRDDKDLVFPLKDKIEAAIGEPCWIDLKGIESDAMFVEVIMSAIDDASIFLFMYSKRHSIITDFEHDWTIRELGYAEDERKRIVFCNIDKTPLTKWFKFMYKYKQQIDMTSPEDLERLLEDLREWLS